MAAEEPDCDQSAPFLMWVENVYYITGNGTTVTGYLERGKLNLHDIVEVVGLQQTRRTVITDMEQNHRLTSSAVCGNETGVLLRGLDRRFAEVGQVLAAPGSIQAYTQFRGNIQLVSDAENGGNHAFTEGEVVEFVFRNTPIVGTYTCVDGGHATGTNRIILICTLTRPVAMEAGQRFDIRVGGKVVGTGNVVELIS